MSLEAWGALSLVGCRGEAGRSLNLAGIGSCADQAAEPCPEAASLAGTCGSSLPVEPLQEAGVDSRLYVWVDADLNVRRVRIMALLIAASEAAVEAT